MLKTKILAVVGPTAVGKTACAISLAKAFDGEIISCDSMQVYRGMDIGTAKPDKSELREVPHHLIDICDTDENFSYSLFCSLAEAAAKDIISRGKLPILCGGTGLYADTFISGTVLSPVGSDEKLRASLEEKDSETLYSMLSEADPVSAEAIHKNNRKRVIRALEIYMLTGVSKSEWDRRSKEKDSRYDALYIGLDCLDRKVLYSRIDERVERMFSKGLTDEVKRLKRPLSDTALQAIGYKELFEYFDGKISLEHAKENIKQASRNYAKRQLTWFKRNPDIKWFHTDAGTDIGEIISYVKVFLEGG